jgi:hypothetical protein
MSSAPPEAAAAAATAAAAAPPPSRQHHAAATDALVSAVEAVWRGLKKGKPQPFEWTVVAAIVATTPAGGAPQVLSLGAGTKCLGRAALRGGAARGLALHDCHAEVLARRALARGLLEEMAAHAWRCGSGGACARGLLAHGDLAAGERAFWLRPGVALHLYISDSPCGDAQRYADADATQCEGSAGGASAGAGVRRTGALAVAGDDGALRTKSGRSDIAPARRTHSMSCSDKVARWLGVGVAGTLASRLLSAAAPPMLLASVTVSADAAALRVAMGAAPASAAAPAGAVACCVCAGAATAAAAAAAAAELPCSGCAGAAADGGGQPLLRPQLDALRRALVARALPSIAAAQRASGGAAPCVPALTVTARVFSSGRAATTARVAHAPAGSSAGRAPTVKRPRPADADADAADAAPSPPPPMLLVGGSGSGAAVVPCGAALAAWRDWAVDAAAVEAGAAAGGGEAWPAAPAAPPHGLHLPAAFISDALGASVGLPLGVASRVFDAAPPPVAAAARVSRVRMARLYAGVCAQLQRCPACGGGGGGAGAAAAAAPAPCCAHCRPAVDAPRASADGAAAPLTLDECKAAAGPAAGGCTYRAAAAAFLAATPAFARDWQHVPAGFAGADVWG